MLQRSICLTPQYERGGPASFQRRLEAGLTSRGFRVTHDLRAEDLQAVLVIGATRQVLPLLKLRRKGVQIVQRLNGMNWIHRQRRTGLRHYVRAEYGNWLLAFTRRFLADRIVYQSNFSRDWWQRVYGPTRQSDRIIYNGVDLSVFNPDGEGAPPEDRCRVLIVEGNLGGGYESGLETAVLLAGEIARRQPRPVELLVAGGASPALQAVWQKRSPVPVQFAGLVAREQIPGLDRSAHLLYAADINAACPNSVIEAMACGLPVLAFDSGALNELVTGQAGRVVPYGGSPWKLDPPDVPALAQASLEILADWPAFHQAARQRAVDAFGLDRMVDLYVQALVEK